VALDRSSIQRTDFPTTRRGYETTAVDAHLREIADEVEGMNRVAAQPVAAAASSSVQRIIEVAETAAEQLRAEAAGETEQQRTQAREETEQLRTQAAEDAEELRAQAAADAERVRGEAGEEAREHVRRVSTAARELLERIGTLQEELGSFLGRLHDDAGRLSSELRALEHDVADLGSAEEAEPEPATEALREEEVVEEPDLEVELAAPTDTTRVDDEEAARLVALDMALGGAPREETEAYLAENYRLSDADKLLDDVYELAGS
jgi:DivIVA domain-containing protein